MNKQIGVSGRVEITQWREGKKVLRLSGNNMIVDDGLEYFAWMLKEMLSPSGAVAAPTALNIGLGTSFVPARRTDTELGIELSPKQAVTTSSLPAAPLTNVTKLDASFGAGDVNPVPPATIREVGLFGHPIIAGVTYTNKLIARLVLPEPGIAKVDGDLLDVSWYITFKRKF